MADRSLRGMRSGSQSLQSEEGVTFSPRMKQAYLCPNCGQETEVVFSADAESPSTWECANCAQEAVLLVDSKPVMVDHADERIPRSHWDMLLERRTIPELEELLEARLTFLRSRRCEQKIGA